MNLEYGASVAKAIQIPLGSFHSFSIGNPSVGTPSDDVSERFSSVGRPVDFEQTLVYGGPKDTKGYSARAPTW
jgi:hypothetical protein